MQLCMRARGTAAGFCWLSWPPAPSTCWSSTGAWAGSAGAGVVADGTGVGADGTGAAVDGAGVGSAGSGAGSGATGLGAAAGVSCVPWTASLRACSVSTGAGTGSTTAGVGAGDAGVGAATAGAGSVAKGQNASPMELAMASNQGLSGSLFRQSALEKENTGCRAGGLAAINFSRARLGHSLPFCWKTTSRAWFPPLPKGHVPQLAPVPPDRARQEGVSDRLERLTSLKSSRILHRLHSPAPGIVSVAEHSWPLALHIAPTVMLRAISVIGAEGGAWLAADFVAGAVGSMASRRSNTTGIVAMVVRGWERGALWRCTCAKHLLRSSLITTAVRLRDCALGGD